MATAKFHGPIRSGRLARNSAKRGLSKHEELPKPINRNARRAAKAMRKKDARKEATAGT